MSHDLIPNSPFITIPPYLTLRLQWREIKSPRNWASSEYGAYWQEKSGTTWTETCPSVIVFTTNPTGAALGVNPRLRGDSHLTCGTALLCNTVQTMHLKKKKQSYKVVLVKTLHDQVLLRRLNTLHNVWPKQIIIIACLFSRTDSRKPIFWVMPYLRTVHSYTTQQIYHLKKHTLCGPIPGTLGFCGGGGDDTATHYVNSGATCLM
jgi:hypothetical protein